MEEAQCVHPALCCYGGRAMRDAGGKAARLSASRQKQAPVTKSITLTKSQINGRERIGRLNVKHRPTPWPAKSVAHLSAGRTCIRWISPGVEHDGAAIETADA